METKERKFIEHRNSDGTTAKISVGENTLIRPSARIRGNDIIIGDRAKIYGITYIGPNSTIGDDSLVNIGATVHNGARLGKNVVVEEFATIDPNSIIGAGSHIGIEAKIHSGARLGKNVVVEKFGIVMANAVVPDGTVIKEGKTYT